MEKFLGDDAIGLLRKKFGLFTEIGKLFKKNVPIKCNVSRFIQKDFIGFWINRVGNIRHDITPCEISRCWQVIADRASFLHSLFQVQKRAKPQEKPRKIG